MNAKQHLAAFAAATLAAVRANPDTVTVRLNTLAVALAGFPIKGTPIIKLVAKAAGMSRSATRRAVDAAIVTLARTAEALPAVDLSPSLPPETAAAILKEASTHPEWRELPWT